MSSTYTRSSTFTITNARYLSSKVAADLHLCAQYYGKPTEEQVRDYAEELAQLLKDGYVSEYEFGYKRNGKRVVCWRYTVRPDGTLTTDDRPGKVVATVDVNGAAFYNFLTHSSAWHALDLAERDDISASLPVQRTPGFLPADGDGYWVADKSYSSGDIGLGRDTFRPSL
jgi:hypothetical protein